VIGRWSRYVALAYPPAVQLPFMVSWAVGLSALFAALTGGVPRWHLDAGLAVTTVTLVVDMLLLRALDDIRDHDYDRAHNPGRPLPSGVVKESDLAMLVAVGGALLLVLNAARGLVVLALAVQLGYALAVILLDRMAGWPPGDRLWLHLAVNLPIQPLLSVYVYAGFLHTEHERPSLRGGLAIVAVTFAGLCLELGRKATRRPRPGERTYATVLGPTGTSAAAVTAAVVATVLVLAALRPWQPGASGYGWLVLATLALPGCAAARFAAGRVRWPAGLTRGYLPAMYVSFLLICCLTKGAQG
jgi:4-hydroxybenzoate polyprenyltransferase